MEGLAIRHGEGVFLFCRAGRDAQLVIAFPIAFLSLFDLKQCCGFGADLQGWPAGLGC